MYLPTVQQLVVCSVECEVVWRSGCKKAACSMCWTGTARVFKKQQLYICELFFTVCSRNQWARGWEPQTDVRVRTSWETGQRITVGFGLFDLLTKGRHRVKKDYTIKTNDKQGKSGPESQLDSDLNLKLCWWKKSNWWGVKGQTLKKTLNAFRSERYSSFREECSGGWTGDRKQRVDKDRKTSIERKSDADRETEDRSQPPLVISSDISNPFHNDPSTTPIQSNPTQSDTTDGIILLRLTLYTIAVQAVRAFTVVCNACWVFMSVGFFHRTNRNTRRKTAEQHGPTWLLG